jgi:rhamnosyltransferase
MEYKDIDILFVIVLYKCKLKDSDTFITLAESLNQHKYTFDLLVYDNSPELSEELTEFPNINLTYLSDTKNSGVSKAYNTGAEVAAGMNKKWIILLDHDTKFPVDTIREYLLAIKKYPGEKLFAPIVLIDDKKIISPAHFIFMRGFYLRSINTGINSLVGYSIINSGMCINLEAFNKNNGYNESIKLDFSDHDFIRRFKKATGDKFVVINLKVYHKLSSVTQNSFESDMVRFDYYLEGAKYIASSKKESFFLKLNAVLRAVKLFLVHHNFGFLTKLFKWI